MQGAGNDFVFLTRENVKASVDRRLAQRLLDRHFGVGGDQLLVLDRPVKKREFDLTIYNADGSQAEMCGNGVRAVAFYLRDARRLTDNFTINTKAGPIGIGLKGKAIEVDMGEPILEGERIPVKARGEIVNFALKVGKTTFRLNGVSMGNPHAVVYVNDVDHYPVREIGPQIENHPFFPRRVNVEFVQVLGKNHVKARVWERGSGETLACGTGACAVAVASARLGKTGRNVRIDLPGGQLRVRWDKNNNRVYLSGPAEVSYKGELPI
jgi:diaminopimelate epimerase